MSRSPLRKGGVSWWIARDDETSQIVTTQIAREHREKAWSWKTYSCPDCQSSMIPKLGELRSDHFAHAADQESCSRSGGEGAAHWKVKVFLFELLAGLKSERYWQNQHYDIAMEETVGRTRPDIVITSDGMQYAIEIVDTHAPEDVVYEQWGDRMLEVEISDWSDEEIQDEMLLLKRLLPSLFDVKWMLELFNSHRVDKSRLEAESRRLLSERKMELAVEDNKKKEEFKSRLSEAREAWQQQEQNLHVERITSREAGYKVSDSIVAHDTRLWFGSIRTIGEKEGRKQWGVQIFDHHGEPAPGDFVIILTKTGQWHSGKIGKCVSKRWDKYEEAYDMRFEKDTFEDPKLSEFMQSLIERLSKDGKL
jgi:hypothetical protein